MSQKTNITRGVSLFLAMALIFVSSVFVMLPAAADENIAPGGVLIR